MNVQNSLNTHGKRSRRRINAGAGLATKPNEKFAEIMRQAELEKHDHLAAKLVEQEIKKEEQAVKVSQSIEFAKKELAAEIEE